MHKWCILIQLEKEYRFDGAFIQDISINYSMIFIFLVEFYFIFLILGKALLSNSQICCSDVIHKDIFKIINAFNLFPTCGYFVLSFGYFILHSLSLFVSAKVHFSPQRPALCFIRLYIISLSLFSFQFV